MSTVISQPPTIQLRSSSDAITMRQQQEYDRRSLFDSEILLHRLLSLLSQRSGEDHIYKDRFQKLHQQLGFLVSTTESTQAKPSQPTNTDAQFWKKGTGYGTEYDDTSITWDYEEIAEQQKQRVNDVQTILISLNQYVQFAFSISNLEKQSSTNTNPAFISKVEKDLYELLSASCVLRVLASLFHNTSLLDISKCAHAYRAAFELVKTFMSIPFLKPLVTSPFIGENTSIVGILPKLSQVAQLFCKTAEKNGQSDHSDITLAKELIATVNDITKDITPSNSSPVVENKLVSTTFQWKSHANHVFLKGSWNNWEKVPLQHLGNFWQVTISLPEGTHEYGFEVNGDWKLDETSPKSTNANNFTNNTITIVKPQTVNNNNTTVNNNDNNTTTTSATDNNNVIMTDVNSTEEIESEYKRILEPLQFDESPILEGTRRSGEEFHYVHDVKNDLTPHTAEKMARLCQEITSMATNLPFNFHSSVFLRVDSERPDVMEALITGPAETPYSNGCFLFHIYVPSDYPHSPPQVNLQTTGHGAVRFNPNLYECGKVCLSLLGTWSSNHPDEEWSEKSTILQVLVSIQSLIFVEQPYFNEPGYESTMNTPEGDDESERYNIDIRKGTADWAIKDMIINPPEGFEEVVKNHFRLKKEEVLNQLSQWFQPDEAEEYKSVLESL